MDSLDLLLETTGEQRADQLSHFDALDSKAGITLGFAGTLIALLPEVGLGFRIVTLALLVGSAASSAAAFWPRKMPTLDVERLRDYLRSEVDFTKLTLHDTYIVMIREASVTLARKTLLLRCAMAFLAAAGATLALALVTGGGHA